ncbi:MAG: YlxR family protein [Armatimonadetes bacterium]|nr:YlxR family protein [Armatimonadota bacterium]
MAQPQRTCIGCKRKGDQNSFLRVSRQVGGRVVLCLGHWMGRTAYICPSQDCIDAALTKERLARALRCSVDEASKAELKQELVCKLR